MSKIKINNECKTVKMIILKGRLLSSVNFASLIMLKISPTVQFYL